ncbi:MAG: hypothetical protein K1X89_13720 [Myxococcaceae bacterium]|nr:hypothetical protein [Myxococcaceae bacterium]
MRTLALAAAVLLGGCVGARYNLPITGPAAQRAFPGVAAAAQQQGLQAYLNDPSRLQVSLPDGTDLYWLTQPNGVVTLDILIPRETPDAEREGRISKAKTTADQLWAQALAERQRFAPVTPVQVVPGVVVVSPLPVRPDAPSTCLNGSDGVQACGWDCHVTSRGAAVCAQTPDGRCALNADGSFSCGRNCQLQANGYHACQ